MRSKLLLGLLVVVTHGIFYHPAGWNQNARLDGVFAFVEPGTPNFRTLRIDDLVNGGGGRGTGTGDWAQAEGHYYSNKPPGSTFLGIVAYLPLQALEHRLGVAWSGASWTNLNSYLINLFVSVLFSALGVVLLFDTLTRRFAMTAIDALLICAAYGWGTLIFSFDATLWGHPTAAAFVMVGLNGLFRGSRAGALQAGFGMGMAVLIDNVSGIAFGLTGIYLVTSATRRRLVGWFALSAMLPLGVLLVYQRVIFGGFLTAPTFRQSPQFLAKDRLGGVFGGISLSVLGKLTFSPYRGAFLFMPVLAFCLPGGRRRFGTDRAVLALCTSAILGTLLLVSSFNGWHGGFSAGPRYLIPVLPFFAFLDARAPGQVALRLVLAALHRQRNGVLRHYVDRSGGPPQSSLRRGLWKRVARSLVSGALLREDAPRSEDEHRARHRGCVADRCPVDSGWPFQGSRDRSSGIASTARRTVTTGAGRR
jgi:hypothetical protein